MSGKRGLAAAALAALLFAPFAAASIPSAADLAPAPPALPELAPTSIEATADPESCGVFCQRLDVRLEAGLFGGGEPDLLALDAWGNYVEGDAGELAKPRVGGEVDAGARPSMAPGTPANPVDRRFTRAELREKYRYAEGTLGKSRAEARAMIESGQLCFRAGTLVHTLSGLKPIEAIEVGDVVLSRDVENGRLEYQKVVQTFRRQAELLLEMTILGEESAPLGVTEEHPFYARRARDNLATGDDAPGWVPAGDLRPGDLVQRPDGSWTLILQIRRISGAPVFNFEVEHNHNYYVGRGGALAHNICARRGRGNQSAFAAEAEELVSSYTGVLRNTRGPSQQTIPGTGPAGFRVPDLKVRGRQGSVRLRGTVVEVKASRGRVFGDLSSRSRHQLLDSVTYARRLRARAGMVRDPKTRALLENARVEVFTDPPAPLSGRYADLIEEGLIEWKRIPR